jgi:DNA-binding MarR family transcriptional regulator
MDGINTDRVAILIKKASLAAERAQSPILQGKGLTVSQYKIIKYLYAAPADSVRLVDLEAFYSMTHPAVIDVVKVLEKKGYCERIPNPADARSKILSLTERAYAERGELEALGDEMEEAVTANLDDAERTQLAALLRKLIGE